MRKWSDHVWWSSRMGEGREETSPSAWRRRSGRRKRRGRSETVATSDKGWKRREIHLKPTFLCEKGRRLQTLMLHVRTCGAWSWTSGANGGEGLRQLPGYESIIRRLCGQSVPRATRDRKANCKWNWPDASPSAWCGEKKEREEVKEEVDRLLLPKGTHWVNAGWSCKISEEREEASLSVSTVRREEKQTDQSRMLESRHAIFRGPPNFHNARSGIDTLLTQTSPKSSCSRIRGSDFCLFKLLTPD